jgi:hypothetical protein
MPDDRCSIRGRPPPQPRSFEWNCPSRTGLIGKMSKSLADHWCMKILKVRLLRGTASASRRRCRGNRCSPRFACSSSAEQHRICARLAPWGEYARRRLPFVELRRTKGRLIRDMLLEMLAAWVRLSRGVAGRAALITRDQFQSYSCTARRRACNCFDKDFPTIWATE